MRALHRCETFVGRTTNWLYDHLRNLPRYRPVILCDQLAHREEFPLLEARSRGGERFSRRVWRKLNTRWPYPSDARWLRRARPALLHSHFGHTAVDDVGLHEFLDVPWLVSYYGADVYETPSAELSAMYSQLFARAHRILALGPRMADRLVALGCPRPKIVVHPLGVDIHAIPHRARRLARGETLRLLFAGTLREKKGLEYAVRAAAIARRSGVRLCLTIVGDTADKTGDIETKERVFQEIARLGIGDAVTHYPYVSFARLLEMALAAHVFVAPSVTGASGDAEGTPFVLQQMMATGMPAIATAHSDIPFLFGDLADRLLAERDAEAIARRLEQYATEPELLVEDGAAMRERICSAFNVHGCAAHLSDLYDELLVA